MFCLAWKDKMVEMLIFCGLGIGFLWVWYIVFAK